MISAAENMRLVMDYYALSNKSLALALGLDPSPLDRLAVRPAMWINASLL